MAATEIQRESINMPALLPFSFPSLVHSFLQKVRKFPGSGGTCLKSPLRKQRQKDCKSEAAWRTVGDSVKK